MILSVSVINANCFIGRLNHQTIYAKHFYITELIWKINFFYLFLNKWWRQVLILEICDDLTKLLLAKLTDTLYMLLLYWYLQYMKPIFCALFYFLKYLLKGERIFFRKLKSKIIKQKTKLYEAWFNPISSNRSEPFLVLLEENYRT